MNNSSGVYTFYPQFSDYVTLYRGVVEVFIGDGIKGQNIGNLYAVYITGEVQDIGPVSSYAVAVSEGYAGPGTDFPTPESWVAHIIETTQNAQTAKDEANRSAMWAAGISTGDGSPTNNSRSWAEVSKSYTEGTDLNDQPVLSREHDNALYYKDLSRDWAIKSTDIETGLGSSKTYAENSRENNLQSESWAKGTRDGSADTERPNASTDNAQYYNNQAKGWATGDGSHQSKNAKEYSLQAESWTKGTRNGSADAVRTDASIDNAKKYSEVSNAWAETGTDLPSGSKSSKEWAIDASNSSVSAEEWATGRTGATYTTGNSAKEQADRAAVWAVGDSTGDGNSTNNAKYWAEQASDSATVASTKAAEASTSADNASQSEMNAQTSETNAKTSENNAATSEINAKSSEDNAADSATAAALSEQNAASSENNAATSEQNAAVSEQNAASSESNAATSETNAATSETNAAASASNALVSERNASSSEQAAASSEQNAAQSESNALQYKNDAEDAKEAAETAQEKAEAAMSHYPRIASNKNWETWDPDNEQWNDTGYKSIAEATIVYSYQNSTSGTVPPTGAWSSTPDPQTGRFLWMKMTYSWTNGSVDYFYNVSYIGANGDGSVDSVNGMGGDVILDGTNMHIDNNAQTKETVYAGFARIGTVITNAEIDALFQ